MNGERPDPAAVCRCAQEYREDVEIVAAALGVSL